MPPGNPPLNLNLAPQIEGNEEQLEEEEDPEEMPGWGHWAMPQGADHELHVGEFLALNDIMDTMEEKEIKNILQI